MRRLVLTVTAAAVAAMFITATALADVPHTINYQGRLTDSGGEPITGSKNMIFTLYAAEMGGDSLWQELHYSVQVSAGLFTVVLGEWNPVPDSVFEETGLWLEISVDGETIDPRTELTAAAYSLSAHSVHGDVITKPGQLGIGETDPNEDLVIGSNVGQAYLGSRLAIGDQTPGARPGIVMGEDDDNKSWMIWDVSGNQLEFGTRVGGTTYSNGLVLKNGQLGVGTDDPSYNLDVSGTGHFEKSVLSGDSAVLHAEFSGSGDYYDIVGVRGTCVPADFCGIGGEFQGGRRGVYGVVYPTGGFTYTGVMGIVDGGSGINRAIYGYASGGAVNYAGYFGGDVSVFGHLSKTTGSFKIDHPLDPENKWLYHSFVESPDMMNVYNGNVILDENGEAVIRLPDYFEALNEDFRYQLTCIGTFAPVYVARKIEGNTFKIAGGEAGMEISWQVTGIRKDAYAQANRIQVEVDKKPRERGKYAHPEVFGLDETMSIDYEHVERLSSSRTVAEDR